MTRRRTTFVGLAVLLVAAVVWGWLDVRQRARTDRGAKYHRTDFTVYTAASEALYAGDDPYEARSPRGWRYVYPPLLAIAMRPLTRLPAPDAAYVWYLANVGVLAVAAVATARAIGAGGVRAKSAEARSRMRRHASTTASSVVAPAAPSATQSGTASCDPSSGRSFAKGRPSKRPTSVPVTRRTLWFLNDHSSMS